MTQLQLLRNLVLLPLTLLPAMAFAQTVRTSVLPSTTDPKIDTFDSPHTLYRNPTVKSRHELLVFLPGTNGKTMGTKLFCTTAADLGYDVISLMYPDDISATVCRNDTDPTAFAKFRQEIIEGSDLSPHIAINRANSIESRLIQLLLYKKRTAPEEGWGQYIDAKEGKDTTLIWDHIAFAGQSQGGGHAALIACRHKVARVLMFSSSKDWNTLQNKPAEWYSPSSTPPSRYFAFVHEQDRQGCTYPQQLEIFQAMGLTKLGKPQSIDTIKAPYAYSHVLTTNYPGTPVTSLIAHTTEVSDKNTPKDSAGIPLFKPIWIYMLTVEK